MREVLKRGFSIHPVKPTKPSASKQVALATPQSSKGKTDAEQAAEAKPPKQKKVWNVTRGPELDVSIILNQFGALSSREIWKEYQRRHPPGTEMMIKSLTQMKKDVLRGMEQKGKVARAGYNLKRKEFLGFKLNAETAFKNVDIGILEGLNPKPNIKKLRSNTEATEVIPEATVIKS